MDTRSDRGLLIAGGVCGILWPILTLSYYAAYPVAAGGVMRLQPGDPGSFALRMAELGQRPVILALEWAYAALPLLLLPFLQALYRLLSRQGCRDLPLMAAGLGLVSIGLMLISHTFNSTALHALGQAYADAANSAQGAAILSVQAGLLRWMRGLNQVSSLLYQGCVALISLALIRTRTWRIWGWVGLLGAVLALPAKLALGLQVPTNVIWTGLAYGLWPLALGIGMLKHRR